jgi:hypothetical protein
MRRNMDLLRDILLERPLDDYTEEEVGYHVHLLGEARLAKVVDESQYSYKSPTAILVALTPEGQDCADLVANDEAWAWAKERIAKVGGSAAFDTWAWLLKRWRDARLREPVPPEVV